MRDLDESVLDDRLKDLARTAAGGPALPYQHVVGRARARRRAHAVAAAGLAATVVLVAGVALRPGTETAAPLPADSPTATVTGSQVPPAVDGQVTDLVELPSGHLALLYGQCPSGRELCRPHVYLSQDGGTSWADRIDLDGGAGRTRLGVRGPGEFDVSAAGDVAVLDDEPARGSGTADKVGGVLVDDGNAMGSYDTDRQRGLAPIDRGSTPVPRDDLLEPVHDIVTARGGEVRVVEYDQVHSLTAADTVTRTAARDGLLVGTATDGKTLVSRNLGDQWMVVPTLHGTAHQGAVLRQGREGLVQLGFGAWDEAAAADPLTELQVSAGETLGWTTHQVTTPGAGSATLVTAVPVGDGTFAAVDADGILYRSDDGGVFRRDPASRRGTVSRLGGHLGQAWALTSNSQLWLRTAATNGEWRPLTLPE